MLQIKTKAEFQLRTTREYCERERTPCGASVHGAWLRVVGRENKASEESLCSVGTRLKDLTVQGTFAGSSPKTVLYVDAFRVKSRGDRVLQNTEITGELPR